MSSRSRSDIAGAEMPPPWRLSPLRSESSPPTRTRVAMAVAPTFSTSRTIWPSLRSSVSPATTSLGRFLYATPTTAPVPAFASSCVSRVKACPSVRCTRPSRKHSMRIFGPPRSSSTPTHLSARCAAARTRSRWRRRSSTVPCEALTRTTSTPARIMSVSTSRLSVAGPAVATILVRRSCRSFGRSAMGALLEHGNGRQGLALDEFQEGAAASGDIGNAVLDAVLFDGREGVAAAGKRERLAARDGAGDGARALAELLEFEHPYGAVPDDGAGRLQQRAAAIRGVRADVEDHLAAAYLTDRTHVRVRGGRKFPGHHDIRRQRDLGAARPRLVHEASRHIQHLRFAQRLADVHAAGGEEGVGDAAADDQLVNLFQQRLEHRELGGDLGATDDGHQRSGGVLQRALQCLQFPHQQGSRARHRRVARYPVGAGLGAVCGAEGVHDKHFAQPRHAPRQLLVVLFLALVKAHVLA